MLLGWILGLCEMLRSGFLFCKSFMATWTEADLRAFTQRRLRDEERTRTKLYEASNSVAGVQNTVGESKARATLVAKPRRAHRRSRRAQVRVSIVSFRRRLLDDDNLTAGAKQIRDVIAEKLEADDAERGGIEFECEQVLTRGTEGTIVKIESLC
jgi:hypothetical protein